MNTWMSLGLHPVWKEYCVQQWPWHALGPRPHILDMACGTGDIALLALHHGRAQGQTPVVWGVDPNADMLNQAQSRPEFTPFLHTPHTYNPHLYSFTNPTPSFPTQDTPDPHHPHGGSPFHGSIQWVCAPAEEVSLSQIPPHSIDLYVTAFGLRNMTDRARALQQAQTVLKPGAWIFALEFSPPSGVSLGPLYQIYLDFLPWMGACFVQQKEAYAYLRDSIRNFPSPILIATEWEQAGFTDVRWEPLTCGIVTLYAGRNP